jgi:nitrile hydratase
MNAMLGMYGVEPRGAAHAAPRFQAGEQVRVLPWQPPGHVRTPHYCRGKTGVVERVCGAFANPEHLAYARDGLPAQPLYRVRFAARELWPDYREHAADTIDIEIFQHWLEPA